MSHFAELDDDNTVTRVIVGDNYDPNGDEGYSWIVATFGGRWVQTSYNGNMRKNFAGVGDTYDEDRDAFISPQPYPSWVLDEDTCRWKAPTPKPTDGYWIWDEASTSWVPDPIYAT